MSREGFPLGYYRLVQEIDDFRDGKVGDLWYLVATPAEHAEIVHGEKHWNIEWENFEDCFEYTPEGIEERQEQITKLMGDLVEAGKTEAGLTNTIQQALAPPASGTPDKEAGKEIALLSDTDLPDRLPGMLKEVKSEFARAKAMVSQHQKALQSFMKEQELILRERATELQAQIELASEAIYVIDVYLGKHEELIRIQDGEPASADEKIHLRQLILYMDEETAAADGWAEEGGIDYQSIEVFDEWVRKPENLQRVLPEQKGVVALKPRRNEKHYSENPFVNEELNRANSCLYVLVRNGERLYRIYSTLWLESRLFPRADEFEELFYRDEFDWDTRESIRRPMKPGGYDYAQAMKKADKMRRRYYASFLLIQGLLDRTKVFQPMPIEGRINICDVHESCKYVTMIRDDEALMTDGRPRFTDWLKEVNSDMEVGCRIVGRFDHGGLDRDELNERVYPRNSCRPDTGTFYTLEDRKGTDLVFRYDRTGDVVYTDWYQESHEPKVRASCRVRPSDSFILCIDRARVEDLEFYMECRLDRHNYEDMLPLLAATVAAKKEEREQEEPFRKLLAGQISQAHGVDVAEAEERVPELVEWWKFKCKTHRALVSDDSKALRMIVEEYGRRIKREKKAASLGGKQKLVVDHLSSDARTLAIFHQRDNRYTRLLVHNDINVFVCEEKWRTDPQHENGVKLVSQKEWTTVDGRHKSWALLFESSRWAEWKINVRAAEYLTDPEINEACEMAAGWIRSEDGQRAISDRGDLRGAEVMALPLAFIVMDGKAMEFYFTMTRAKVEEDRPIRGNHRDPKVGCSTIIWEKKAGVPTTFRIGYTREAHVQNWEKAGRVVRTFPEGEAEYERECERVVEIGKQEKRLESTYRRSMVAIWDVARERWYEEQHQEFLKDYSDPDGSLWEEKREEMRCPLRDYQHWLDQVLGALVEVGEEINGWTVERALIVYRELVEREKASRAESGDDRDLWRMGERDKELETPYYDYVSECVIEITEPEEPEDEEDE